MVFSVACDSAAEFEKGLRQLRAVVPPFASADALPKDIYFQEKY